MNTAKAHDGALPGTYKVTIESDADAGGIKVPARFADPEHTILRCAIRAGANILDFDLRGGR